MTALMMFVIIVYPEVFKTLQSLTVPIYIYSSGSVLAQKLLFGHTIDGDMTKVHISITFYSIESAHWLLRYHCWVQAGVGVLQKDLLTGYFDTTVGFKQESESYRKICNEIDIDPAEVLFLTDVEAEGRAAREAGLQVRLVVRDGNAPLSAEAVKEFTVIHSLEEIV
ncbi:unnamed protein product [Heligmosomoides polygyrus]|uniref:Enolase-phosphatase E1 n=1 Tax=Heligmosomoides polygyrus TaxID=6339 RepID=A0A183GRC6_HELPZ|nr:unnamed protein product [Heligmosomoides polygyrus]